MKYKQQSDSQHSQNSPVDSPNSVQDEYKNISLERDNSSPGAQNNVHSPHKTIENNLITYEQEIENDHNNNNKLRTNSMSNDNIKLSIEGDQQLKDQPSPNPHMQILHRSKQKRRQSKIIEPQVLIAKSLAFQNTNVKTQYFSIFMIVVSLSLMMCFIAIKEFDIRSDGDNDSENSDADNQGHNNIIKLENGWRAFIIVMSLGIDIIDYLLWGIGSYYGKQPFKKNNYSLITKCIKYVKISMVFQVIGGIIGEVYYFFVMDFQHGYQFTGIFIMMILNISVFYCKVIMIAKRGSDLIDIIEAFDSEQKSENKSLKWYMKQHLSKQITNDNDNDNDEQMMV